MNQSNYCISKGHIFVQYNKFLDIFFMKNDVFVVGIALLRSYFIQRSRHVFHL